MFDEIDPAEYDRFWNDEAEFAEWVAAMEEAEWVAMMEEAALIRVNVELRELAAD